MTASLLTLVLSLTLGQAGAHDAHTPAADPHSGAVQGHTAAGGQEAIEAEGGHAQGGGHGGGGELGGTLLHHVSDGYVMEYPGRCHGEWAFNCELDLKEVFGDRFVFTVGGLRIDMTPTKHVVMMWLASALLVLAFVAAVRRRGLVPRGLYNFLEMLVQFVRNEIALKNIGEKEGERFVPYLVTAFFFILFLNLFGLIPYSATATGNLGVTVALASFTFVITQYTAIRSMGFIAWVKHLGGGVPVLLAPIMVPVELLGLFTKPFALTIRLFANMIAGHIVILSLLGLIYVLGSQWIAIGSVPMALAIFLLELFVAFVQAYIFTMLSALFIGQGLAHHGHDEEHGHEGHGEPGMGSAGHGKGSHVAGAVPGHG
jgi:F-type H+-transporting ATPase subunit a